MIIVEGMDNSGKTTLVETLMTPMDKQGIEVHTEHSPSQLIATGRIKEWLTWIEISFMPENQRFIYDRHPVLSEMVYGPILRGANLLKTTDHLARLKLLNPLIIYCRPDDDTIFDFRKPEMKGVKKNKDKLIVAYDSMIRSLYNNHFDVWQYNFKNKKSDQMIRFLTQRVANHLDRE